MSYATDCLALLSKHTRPTIDYSAIALTERRKAILRRMGFMIMDAPPPEPERVMHHRRRPEIEAAVREYLAIEMPVPLGSLREVSRKYGINAQVLANRAHKARKAMGLTTTYRAKAA